MINKRQIQLRQEAEAFRINVERNVEHNLFSDSERSENPIQILSDSDGSMFEVNDDNQEVNVCQPESAEIAGCGIDLPEQDKLDSNIFLCDTGASTHLTNSLEGMDNLRECVSDVTVGNSQSMRSTLMGTKHVSAIQLDGSVQDFGLENTKYVPDLWMNLFAVGRALDKG